MGKIKTNSLCFKKKFKKLGKKIIFGIIKFSIRHQYFSKSIQNNKTNSAKINVTSFAELLSNTYQINYDQVWSKFPFWFKKKDYIVLYLYFLPSVLDSADGRSLDWRDRAAGSGSCIDARVGIVRPRCTMKPMFNIKFIIRKINFQLFKYKIKKLKNQFTLSLN